MMTEYLKTLDPMVQKIFESMNLTKTQEEQLLHPQHIVLTEEPVYEVIEFFEQAQKLMICGDYDCDGIASTSIAMLIAKAKNIEAGYYIPNRFTEGYGVSVHTIDLAYEKGYTDILLIDNGVKAHEAIQRANQYNMNVCIVDHHIMDEELSVDALLHPDVLSDYFASMCASGLIYCVAETMEIASPYMLSLAALATIADVMPLWGKNREIVKAGVEALNGNRFLQFDAIVKAKRNVSYTAKTLAFQMIPKVNSVGRMADIANVNTTVAYFLSEDEASIRSYAQQMLLLNDKRKKIGEDVFRIAKMKITGNPFEIISDPSFHEGLVGIAANKIAELTQRPSVILTEYEDHYKGSARSMDLSLQEIFSQLNSDYFVAMGGHDFAFGMTIHKSRFEEFNRDIQEITQNMASSETPTSDILHLDPNLITQRGIQQLSQFEPYGEGFQLPLVQVAIPDQFDLINLKGYGYKFVFKHFNISEAVYFKANLNVESLRHTRALIGSFDLQSLNKNSLSVQNVV